MRDNNLKEYEEVIDQYFTSDVHYNMGDHINDGSNTVELKPGGKNIRVTDDNKQEFIRKKCYFIGYQCVSEQLQSLMEGFHKVIPSDWLKIFTSDELEAAICGNSHIDLDDWKSNTEIKGFTKWS